MGERVDKGHPAHLAMGVDATGQIEAVFQWLPSRVIVADRVMIVLEGGSRSRAKVMDMAVHLLSRLG
jgi:hypothetical protein